MATLTTPRLLHGIRTTQKEFGRKFYCDHGRISTTDCAACAQVSQSQTDTMKHGNDMTWLENPYEIRTSDNLYFSSPLDENRDIPASTYLNMCKAVDGAPTDLVISRRYMDDAERQNVPAKVSPVTEEFLYRAEIMLGLTEVAGERAFPVLYCDHGNASECFRCDFTDYLAYDEGGVL